MSYDGAEYAVVEPAQTTTRPPPKTIEPTVDSSFAPLSSYAVPERALVKIPNARIRGRYGLVMLPDDAFVGELVALTRDGRQRMLRDEPSYYEPIPKRSTYKKGNFYVVLGFGVDHYYHWGHDLVMGMHSIVDRLPPDTQLIVPEQMKPFQIDTLGLLGLDDNPRVPYPADEVWLLENLYVVVPKLKTQIDTAEPYLWFRQAAMERYGIREVTPTRRLYLTRRHDHHWRTTNEDQVESFLTARGFETVAPGRLSFREQIELFGQADVIVGTGAGLFNMTFSPPGTKVLQFQETNHVIHTLWVMAAALGIDYHYFFCDIVSNPGGANVDIHVPLEKLEASLADITVS
jgi:hypothetical protein